MSLKEFSIKLDTPNNGYFRPGDTLRGKVLITCGNSNPFHTLKITLFGRARNTWYKKSDGSPLLLETVEEYLNFEAEMNISDSKSIENAEYGFEYELSEGLPSSFTSTRGDIKYTVTAILEGTDQSETTTQEIVISGQVNLNEMAEVALPIEMKFTQPLLFDTGHLLMDVKLEKTGFVGGEKIFVESEFQNPSGEEVRVNLCLMKETVFYGKGQYDKVFPIATHTESLKTVEGPTLKPQEITTWKGDALTVPTISFPFPFFQNCSIIKQRFFLTFEMEIPLPNINLEGRIPLVLGTVPLKDVNGLVSVESGTYPTAKARKMEKKAIRRNRAMTTCLVFRPDRPRLKLPEPKPDSWKKPKSKNATSEVNIAADIEQKLTLESRATERSEPETHSPLPSPQVISPPIGKGETEQKWPKPFIRRRQVLPGDKPKQDVGEKAPPQTPPPVEPTPPPKPARLRKKKSKQAEPPAPIIGFVATDLHHSTEKLNSEEVNSEVKNSALPYPTSTTHNFPVPDFSFNVSINGLQREPIGWNVTRNTLTLKRGVYQLRDWPDS